MKEGPNELENIYGKSAFIEWLRLKGLSESSRAKYAVQADNRIKKDLGVSFYELRSIAELGQLLIDVKKLENLMDRDPKRMYSSAVSNFIKFRVERIDIENTIKDMLYENEVEKILVSESSKSELNHVLQPKSVLVEETNLAYTRNPKVGAVAIMMADYRCQINTSHRTFTSRRTKRNYVEAHHLIPIAYQGLFESGIDTIENITSLCPVCHRCVHYGEDCERLQLIQLLHKSFQKQLFQVGIEIKEKELLELYQIY